MTRRSFLTVLPASIYAGASMHYRWPGDASASTPVATSWYCDQPQPWEGYLYDFKHIRVRNQRGDEFVVPYNEQFGDNFFNAAGRMSRAFYCDGPRGIGHTTPYISGAVLPNGDLAFVETSPRGRVGVLGIDGTVTTLCGWRLKPDIIPYNPWDTSIPDLLVRDQYEHVGNADMPLNLPTDIGIDPLDPDLWYIADNENARIALFNRRTRTLRTYAGMPGVEGYVDGPWASALFHYPSSLCVLPDRTMYVTDMGNHCLRKISRDGLVTTVIGVNPLVGGVPRPPDTRFTSYTRVQTRAWRLDGDIATTTLLYPLCVRADSQGRLCILEPWFSSIRRYDPVAGILVTVYDLPGSREWQWLDCDREGSCGPRDDFFVAHKLSNLTRIASDGTRTQELMTGSLYIPAHELQCMAPHYPWMVAVGHASIWCNGFGTMGVTRIRPKLPTDYVYTPTDIARFKRGQKLWLRGDASGFPGVSGQIGANLLYGRFGIGGLATIEDSTLHDAQAFLVWIRTYAYDLAAADAEDVRFFLCAHRNMVVT